jgi:hypothetical protein
MKKRIALFAAFIVIVMPVASFAIDATFPATPPANTSSFTTMGYPVTCAPVYVDNVARSVQSLIERAGCPWQVGDAATGRALSPIGMMVSCDTNATRWAAGMTPSTTAGHKVAGEGSFYFPGTGWPVTGMAIAVGAADNVTCAVTRSF